MRIEERNYRQEKKNYLSMLSQVPQDVVYIFRIITWLPLPLGIAAVY